MLPDLPGNGRLHRLRSPVRVEDMVDLYRTLVFTQDRRLPFCLLAVSLGAMVAVDWAHRYAGEPAGWMLMNTRLRPLSPFHWRPRWRSYPDLLRLALSGRDMYACKRLALRLMSSRAEAHASGYIHADKRSG